MSARLENGFVVPTTDEERDAWLAEHADDLRPSWCRYCRPIDAPEAAAAATGSIRLELRREFIAKPLGTFSLAGMQMKASAIGVWWPWAVCEKCGHASRGSL